ncbi:hypothetical protein, partial [Chryseobacterium sp. CCH4-E10]|uniref:hypothetical protein n=1 Tax=Chryseobacterium sp. CCH4-E10 TaxID=1768758 RepID=UPI000A43A0DB
PTSNQLYQLKKWFWITTYSNYFTIYNLSKQRIAYYKFQEFIYNENVDPIYYDQDNHFVTQKFPEKISMGSVRSKALALFMLNYSVNHNNILGGLNFNADSNLYSGYKSYKLFKEKENMVPSNTVFVPIPYSGNVFGKPVRQSELRFLLDELYFTEENYFITRKMKEDYWYNRIDDVLAKRRREIKNAEMKFVEQLNIEYLIEDFDDLDFPF